MKLLFMLEKGPPERLCPLPAHPQHKKLLLSMPGQVPDNHSLRTCVACPHPNTSAPWISSDLFSSLTHLSTPASPPLHPPTPVS